MKREKKNDSKVWFTSDPHINHNKEFIYKARGFDSIEEMNEAIVNNWNEVVSDDDIVYCLGDVSMGETKKNNSLKLIKKLKGHIILIVGNHDTDNRLDIYKSCPNIEQIIYGYRFRVGKRSYVLSHRPVYMGNVGDDKPCWCISGHTHSKEKFSEETPFNYCVCLDAHGCYPVSFEQIEKDIKEYTRRNAEVDKLLEPYLNMSDKLKETIKDLENMI